MKIGVKFLELYLLYTNLMILILDLTFFYIFKRISKYLITFDLIIFVIISLNYHVKSLLLTGIKIQFNSLFTIKLYL